MHRLLLCREVRHLPNECPRYDTKQSDGESPVMVELWGMRSTPSFSSLPAPLYPGVVAPDRVLSVGQIELNCVLMLNWIVWNRTVYMYKNGFGINNLLWLMCHKTKPNKQTDECINHETQGHRHYYIIYIYKSIIIDNEHYSIMLQYLVLH